MIGLDIGTMNLLAAFEEDGEVNVRRIRDAFLAIDPSDHLDSSFGEEMLKKSGSHYLKVEDELHILGDDALEFANMMSESIQRPMKKGVFNPNEPKRHVMMKALIKGVVGDKSGENIVYSSPASPINDDYDVEYHQETLRDLLNNIGFSDPEPMTESLAIIYEEFSDDYSGIGLSLGAGMANISMAWRGMPVLEFSMMESGDWIDEGVAQKVNEMPNVVTHVKEEGGFDVSKSRAEFDNPIHRGISVYYGILVDNIIEGIQHLYKNTPDKDLPNITKPVPICVAGGTAQADGFLELFNDAIQSAELPFEIGDIKRPDKAIETPARGLLEAARVQNNKNSKEENSNDFEQSDGESERRGKQKEGKRERRG